METILVTGASGEVGLALIDNLLANSDCKIVAMDLRQQSLTQIPQIDRQSRLDFVQASITDRDVCRQLFEQYNFDSVFHLAGILSSGGEKDPEVTHNVNVQGSVNLLECSQLSSARQDKSVKFIFPSTIAVYGIDSLEEKERAYRIAEDQFNRSLTMYGINKLYIEQLGRYYSENYKLLEDNSERVKIDFRSVRYPGLISADTLPTGGTSDYAAEMVHAAVTGKNYSCFVREDSTLPFMTMPDAIRALLEIAQAPKEQLSRMVYNVGAFSVSAEQIYELLKSNFPKFEVEYSINRPRQKIVDSWPKDVDDTAARQDWSWQERHNFEQAFYDYLIPKLELNSSSPKNIQT
jgi:threonine 3-dehydrogenase